MSTRHTPKSIDKSARHTFRQQMLQKRQNTQEKSLKKPMFDETKKSYFKKFDNNMTINEYANSYLEEDQAV